MAILPRPAVKGLNSYVKALNPTSKTLNPPLPVPRCRPCQGFKFLCKGFKLCRCRRRDAGYTKALNSSVKGLNSTANTLNPCVKTLNSAAKALNPCVKGLNPQQMLR